MDSNEYVFYIMGLSDVVEFVMNAGAEVCIHIAIIEEVWRNLMKPAHKTAFLSILLSPGIRIYTDKLPVALRDKYAGLGLRGGDILIAAYQKVPESSLPESPLLESPIPLPESPIPEIPFWYARIPESPLPNLPSSVWALSALSWARAPGALPRAPSCPTRL